MPQLSTPVPLSDYPFRIGYQHRLLSMGSCFAEHIGEYLQDRKFQQVLSPFGIVYHPVVLARLLRQLLDDQAPQAVDLFEQQSLWRHYDFHSRFSGPEKASTQDLLGRQHKIGAEAVRSVDVLLLTLGTAYGYQLKSSGEWVNNCHKQAADFFAKVRSEGPEMTSALAESFELLKKVNPNLQIILTVSPVRHLRDGLLENQRSKARLLLCQEALTSTLDFVHYFPAYEILLDELRDYRYYANDLLHPSALAIEIITARFAEAFLEPEAIEISQQVWRLLKATRHRPMHPGSLAAKQFLSRTKSELGKLSESYPFLDFSEEISQLS